MAELTRVSMSLEENLLQSFDKLIARRGYETRSEAIRDLIRDSIVRDQARSQKGEQVAVVSSDEAVRGTSGAEVRKLSSRSLTAAVTVMVRDAGFVA